MSNRPARLGLVGALAIAAATFAAASTLPTMGVAAFALALVGMSAWLAPDALRRMSGPRTLAILLLLGGASWLGQTLAAQAGGVSPAAVALHIVMRVGTILLALGLVAHSLPLEQFAAGMERLGLKNFGFAMGVAVNSLPLAERSLLQVWRALRLRRPHARGRLHAWRLAATTVATRMLAGAEDTVAVAQARGYDPARAQRMPLTLTHLDLALALAAIAIVAGCVYYANC